MGGEEIHFASRPLLLPVLTLTHPKTHVISTGGGALAVASYASSKVYSGIVTQYNFLIPVSGGKQSRKARRTQQQAAQRLEKALQEVRMEDNEKQTAADATSASQGKKAPIGWIKRFTFWFSNPANSNWIIAVFTALLFWAAVSQYGAMNGQLEIMNGQLGVMQNDERAWIAVRKNPPKGEEILAIDLIEGQPVVVPMKYINVGKTPALHPQMHIFAEVVDADKEAHFKCMDAEENCPGLKGNISIAGIVFPNGDMPVIVSRQSPTTNAEVSA
jgi:hypothetical protein